MEGKQIDGRFEILAVLGEGGMAKVYRAFDQVEQREVAIKIVSHGGSKDDDALPRFSREFRLCQQVDHPHIIKLHHFGALDKKSCYTVMDVVEGTDLRQLLEAEGRLDEELVLHIAKNLADALSCLHENNIVHRDLKPANIMLTEQDSSQAAEEPELGTDDETRKWAKWHPVIMDFGLARGMNMTRLTATGTIMGTPYYMSPELAIGDKADNRSDFFQLGSILYELLTGKRAFEGRQIAELLNNIVAQDPVPVTELVPELSQKWDAILDKCLEKDRAFRYQSAAELLADLESFHEASLSPKKQAAGNEQVAASKQVVGNEQIGVREQVAASAIAPPSAKGKGQAKGLVHGRSKKPAKRVSAALALLLIIFVGALYLVLAQSEERSYSCRNINIVPLANSVTISWESEHAYPSLVELVSPQQRTIGDGKGKATKRHRLTIEGLIEQAPYKFRIVYPNGESSLAKSFTTQKMQFSLLAAEQTEAGLLLSWALKPRAKKCQLLLWEDNEKPLKFPLEPVPMNDFTLPKLHEKTHRIVLLAQYECGKTKEWDFRQAMLKLMESCKNEIGSLTAARIIDKFSVVAFRAPSLTIRRVASKSLDDGDYNATRKAEREEAVTRRKRMKSLLLNELRKCNRQLTAYNELCKISHLALSARLLTLDEQRKFDVILSPFITIYSFAAYEKIGEDIFPLPNRGDYAFSFTPLSGDCKEVVIFDEKLEKTMDLGIPMPFKHPAQERWKRQFHLESLQGVSKAEICFQFRRFDNTSLDIRLNGQTDIKTFGHRGFAAAGRLMWQRVPIRALREGKNEIVFQYAKIAKGHLETRVRIIKCTLRLCGSNLGPR